jgi:hypothetical protein
MDKDKINTEEVEAELKTRFQLLPKEIQDVITSSDYQMKLFELAKKHKLTYDQLGTLEFNTTLTLVGMLAPTDYEAALVNELNKKKEEVDPIINDVSEQVFKPIRASLMSIYQNPSSSDAEEETAEEFQKAGISLQPETPKVTPSVGVTENRNDILAAIENPVRSNPKPLETKAAPVSAMPISKGEAIPVPRAPYAGTTAAPTVQQPVPMTAKPAGDMLASKLSGNFAMPAKETDHSLKPSAVPPASKGGDSYREPIE